MTALNTYISKMKGFLTKKSKRMELYKEALNILNNDPKLIPKLLNEVKGGLPKALAGDVLLRNLKAVNLIINSCNSNLIKSSGLSFLKLYRVFNEQSEFCRKDVRYIEHCLRFGLYSSLLEARKNFIKNIVNCEGLDELNLVVSLGNGMFTFELDIRADYILASYPYILAIRDNAAYLYLTGREHRVKTFSIPFYPQSIKAGDFVFLMRHASSSYVITSENSFKLGISDVIEDKIATASINGETLLIRVVNRSNAIEWEKGLKIKGAEVMDVRMSRDLSSAIVCVVERNKDKTKIIRVSRELSPISVDVKGKIVGLAELPFLMGLTITDDGRFYLIDWGTGKISHDFELGDRVVGIEACFGFGVVAWSNSKLYVLDSAGNVYAEHTIHSQPKFVENPFIPLMFSKGQLYTLRSYDLVKIDLSNLGIKDVVDVTYNDGILFILDRRGGVWCLNPILLEVISSIKDFDIREDLLNVLSDLIERSTIDANAAAMLVSVQRKMHSNDLESVIMNLASIKDELKSLKVIGLCEAFNDALSDLKRKENRKLVELKSKVQLLISVLSDDDQLKTILMINGGKLYLDKLNDDIIISEFLLGRKIYDLDILLGICLAEYDRYDKVSVGKILKAFIDAYSSGKVLSFLVRRVVEEGNDIAREILLSLGYDIDGITSKIDRLKELEIPERYREVVNKKVKTVLEGITSGKIAEADKLAEILLTVVNKALNLRNDLKKSDTLPEILEIYDSGVEEVIRDSAESYPESVETRVENIYENVRSFSEGIDRILKTCEEFKFVNRVMLRELIIEKVKGVSWKELSRILHDVQALVSSLYELETRLEKVENTVKGLEFVPEKFSEELSIARDKLRYIDVDVASRHLSKLELDVSKLVELNTLIREVKGVLDNLKIGIRDELYAEVGEVVEAVKAYELEEALSGIKAVKDILNQLTIALERINSIERWLSKLARYVRDVAPMEVFKERVLSEVYRSIKGNRFDPGIIEDYERRIREVTSNVDRMYVLLNTCLDFFTRIDESLKDVINTNFRVYLNRAVELICNLSLDSAVKLSGDMLSLASDLCYIKNKSLEIMTLLEKLPQRLRRSIENNLSKSIHSILLDSSLDFKSRIGTLMVRMDQLRRTSTILEEIRIRYFVLEGLKNELKSSLLRSIVDKILDMADTYLRELRFGDALRVLYEGMEIEQKLRAFDPDLAVLEREGYYNALQDCIARNVRIEKVKAIGEVLSRIKELAGVLPYIRDERVLTMFVSFVFKEPIIGEALVRLIQLLNPDLGGLLTEMMKEIELKDIDDAVKIANIALFLKSLKAPKHMRYDPMIAHLSLITTFSRSESVKDFKDIRDRAIKICENLESREDLERLIGYTAILCILGGNCKDLLERLGADMAEKISSIVDELASRLNLKVEGLEQLILETVVIPIWSYGLESKESLLDEISTFDNLSDNKKSELFALIQEILSSSGGDRKVSAVQIFNAFRQVLEIFRKGIESVARKYLNVKICGELDPNAWSNVDVMITNTGPFTFVIERAELHTFTIQKVEFGGLTIVNPNSCIVGKSIARAQNPQERETPALIRLTVKIPSLPSVGPAVMSYEYPIPVKSTELTEIIDRIRMRYDYIEVREVIGVGGNSIVLKVFDLSAKEYRVLKLPSYAVRSFAPTLSNVERALDLVERLKGLSCPNMARIIRFEFEPFPHVFEEYIEGENLRVLMNKGVRFSLRDILVIVEDIIKAVICLHENGLYHNDIRPENVIITPSGAKLIDVGVDEIWNVFKEAFGHARSTLRDKIAPCYMHPKLKLSDELMDVFQIGVLMYELIAGFSPFCGREVTEIRPLSSVIMGIPKKLDELIQKIISLSEAPSLSLKELLAEIQSLKREVGV